MQKCFTNDENAVRMICEDLWMLCEREKKWNCHEHMSEIYEWESEIVTNEWAKFTNEWVSFVNIYEFQLESALKTIESKNTTKVFMSYSDIDLCL